jgi:uncharacterized protein
VNIHRRLDIDESRLAEICERFQVAELLLFGSVLRDDFGPDSDIDVLYVLEDGATIGWEIVDLQQELERLFDRKVDLVSKNFLRPRFAAKVLPTAERIFEHAA